uniref:Uncharacterized protein n=1 Tax=Nelumbo nucifera TaxID=4432 RepID=A0A822ZGQ0_NELNU|nr:TPA_asm: hypothetical protein HUJ06_000879 [Nelumbo nucifera]
MEGIVANSQVRFHDRNMLLPNGHKKCLHLLHILNSSIQPIVIQSSQAYSRLL